MKLEYKYLGPHICSLADFLANNMWNLSQSQIKRLSDLMVGESMTFRKAAFDKLTRIA